MLLLELHKKQVVTIQFCRSHEEREKHYFVSVCIQVEQVEHSVVDFSLVCMKFNETVGKDES